MNVWSEFGFRDSPYNTNPIEGTREGANLLVGRDQELRRLTRFLTSSVLHPTIEGENGVGKSSLVAIAGYELQHAYSTKKSSVAYLPIGRNFQLSTDDTAQQFSIKVLYQVAQAFIDHHESLRNGGYSVPEIKEVNNWLNAPTVSSRSGGGSVLGVGGNIGKSKTINTSEGFANEGFVALITTWLRNCFPNPASGGFICVIDNLELLETSKAAKALLEEMRDNVLNLPGLKWVLCGAKGIVRTGASSPRLEGRLADPLELTPVQDEQVELAIERRIEVFQENQEAIAPVGPDSFRFIYDVLNRNLRNALRYSESFAMWASDMHPSESLLDPRTEYIEIFELYIRSMAKKHLEETALGPRAWQVFDGMIENGGSISPGDHDLFHFNSVQAMAPHINKMEECHLVQRSIEDSDKRRKTISISPRGWLVNHARNSM